MGHPIVMAASANPATIAPVPSTPCANSGTYDVSPSISTPTTRETAIAAPTTRWRKTHSGSTGSAARRSTRTKAVSTTADPTSSPMLTGDAHSQMTPPSRSATSRATVPTRSSTVPRTSIRGRAADGSRPTRFSSNRRHSIQAAATPSGRLTKKIQRHDEVVGEDAAERRPDERGDRPDRREVPLHLRALGDGVDVTDDRHADRLHRAGAEPLDEAERHEAAHRPGEPAQQRPERRTVRRRGA